MRKFLTIALCFLAFASASAEELGSPGSRAGNGSAASLTRQGQILQGGATTVDICAVDGTPFGATACSGSFTINCAFGPNQVWNNNSASPTLTAPALSGMCDIWAINGASAGTITFSGFSVGANTGDALTTTNGNKFVLWFGRANGTSSYQIKALQ